MKPEFIEFIENARKPKGLRFRNQLYVFFACLVISVFIWSLVRLSKDYIYTINYNINYINAPQKLRLIDKSDTVIKLNIKVQGFDFFTDQYFKHKNKQFEVSLRNIKILNRDTFIEGYLLTSHIGREIAAQSGYPLEIYSVSPDTLFFRFERKSLKTMPVIKTLSVTGTKTRLSDDSSHHRPDSVFNESYKSVVKKSKTHK